MKALEWIENVPAPVPCGLRAGLRTAVRSFSMTLYRLTFAAMTVHLFNIACAGYGESLKLIMPWLNTGSTKDA
jgi:hypothetical protein